MIWDNWSSGLKNWPFGALTPDEVLYDFDGPAIFTSTIGLHKLLFYKADIHDDGDFYLAVNVSQDKIDALKAGRLSVRGALLQPHCWIFDVDFDLRVQQYEEKQLDAVIALLPKAGVPLYASLKTAPDSVQQATSPLAFKFFGDDLLRGSIPFSIFKGIINEVYEVVRRSLTPPSLTGGRDAEIIKIPLFQPALNSLLIAIDVPSIDVSKMKRRNRTKNLDPITLLDEAQKEGARFIEQVERTVDVASSGKISMGYARDHFEIFDRLNEIIPAENGDVSKLQISSYLDGQNHFIELDRKVGEKIRNIYREVRDQPQNITGKIVGMVRKSHTFILRPSNGREVTCHLVPAIYDNLLLAGELHIGRKLSVSGVYQKRDYRDLIKVDGEPALL